MAAELEADAELEHLKDLANTVLTIKSRNTLSPNNALYPEMSQILSMANQYYAKAQDLIKEGKKAEADDILRKAKDKLNELKIVYPRNQEANLLSMRIDRILDIESFNESFRTKFLELKKVNYASRNSAAQIAYSDLQDLYAIEPNYPGLKSLINSAQIDLGMKERPVDNSAKIQAQKLAEQAKKDLVDAGRDAAALESIKATANQALAKDPNNDTAIAVLDEIALRTGAQSAVVLSAADEERYQAALTYLQAGNVVAANSQLQALLKTPANRRSAKILKLKSRIEGMLQ
jgi:hypothetical protein